MMMKEESNSIVFNQHDKRGIVFSREDVIVIMTVIANVEVRRILLDSGSSVDVLFYEAYQGMGIEKNVLMPHYTPLVRFIGGIVHTMGEILFPLSIADEPKR